MKRKHPPIDTRPSKNIAGNQISSCMTIILSDRRINLLRCAQSQREHPQCMFGPGKRRLCQNYQQRIAPGQEEHRNAQLLTTHCFQLRGLLKTGSVFGFLCRSEPSFTHAKFPWATLLRGFVQVPSSIGGMDEDFCEGYYSGIMRGVHRSRLANCDGSRWRRAASQSPWSAIPNPAGFSGFLRSQMGSHWGARSRRC